MDTHENKTPLDIDNLRAVKVLGRGATGTVFLVRDDSPRDQPFALKVVEKSHHHHHAPRRARHEISVLRRISAAGSPFLPHLIGSSENEDLICWATPFCPGGDLNVLRRRQNDRAFSPAVIRFYAAEVVCALGHLHAQGLVYRDLKPENILVQLSGHVTLTDFDLSRDLAPSSHPEEAKPLRNKKKAARVSPVSRRNPNERSNSFVGTEEYVAPEVIRGDGHEFGVDWWALGVLCYEMLYGATPFKGKSREETFRRILLAEPEFIGRPSALTGLIRELLEKDPTRRLGSRGGASEIMEHEFFRGLGWDLLTEVSRPPFLPSEDEDDEGGGIGNINEYFLRLKQPPSPLWSPSLDECRDTFSLTEF